jgi:hypothetical protein
VFSSPISFLNQALDQLQVTDLTEQEEGTLENAEMRFLTAVSG